MQIENLLAELEAVTPSRDLRDRVLRMRAESQKKGNVASGTLSGEGELSDWVEEDPQFREFDNFSEHNRE